MNKPTCTDPTCERPVQARGMCSTHYSYWWRANNTSRQTCTVCGQAFRARRSGQKTCSASCHGLAANRASTAARAKGTDLVPRPLQRTWLGSSVRGQSWVCGPCSYCGGLFTAQARARYCSDKCKRRAKEARRYLRKGEFAVSKLIRTTIYERDNFTCQICGQHVDTLLHYLDPMSATLDHIIPQSWQLVPDHSPSNLRLAHRMCNSERGNRPA